MELKYNNKNRINPSAFNKLETYIFQFENALSIEKIIELNEVVFKGCKHFEAIYLSQKEKLKKSKLTNIEISENPYLNEVFELYNSYKKLLNDIENHQKTNEATKPETSTPDEVNTPNFNANYFNENAYNLFNYLIVNYEKNTINKYTNIWYFMKYDIDKNKYKYKFTITQDNYTEYILKKYSVKISKFGKATYKYEDTEKPTLIQLEEDFRSLNKLI